MNECIYQTGNYKIMFSYDGFQVWQSVSKRYNIFAYVKTFKVLAQAIKFIENIEKLKK